MQAVLRAKAPLSVGVPVPLPMLPGPHASPAERRWPCPAPQSFAVAHLGPGVMSQSRLCKQCSASCRAPLGRLWADIRWDFLVLRVRSDSCAFSTYLDLYAELSGVVHVMWFCSLDGGHLRDPFRNPQFAVLRLLKSCNNLGLPCDLSDALTVSATSSSQSCGHFQEAAYLAEQG